MSESKTDDKQETSSRVVWVIEKGSPAQYFCGFDYGSGRWTADFNKAMHASERELVQRLWDCDRPIFTIFNDDCRIADHMICVGPIPYTDDQQRVADYILSIQDAMGSGDDPIGFLIASHAALREQLLSARGPSVAIEKCPLCEKGTLWLKLNELMLPEIGVGGECDHCGTFSVGGVLHKINDRITELKRSKPAIENIERVWKDGYLAGFNESGEGYNGEYPYADNNRPPQLDQNWCQAMEQQWIDAQTQYVKDKS